MNNLELPPIGSTVKVRSRYYTVTGYQAGTGILEGRTIIQCLSRSGHYAQYHVPTPTA